MTTPDDPRSIAPGPEPVAAGKRRFSSGQIVRYLPLILLAVAIIAIGLATPNFLTARNAVNILRQSAALGLMAIGMTTVMMPARAC